MAFFKENLAWLAPTTAILLVGSVYLYHEGAIAIPGVGGDAQEEAAAPSPRVERLNAIVQSAVAPQAETTFAASPTPATQEQVSRTVTADLLQVAPTPEPIRAPAPVPEVDTQQAVDFFAAAQSRLAVDSNCVEDVRALAAQTRVYFPAGGLSGEAAGINAARLIGSVAAQCPGYTLRVEGHSDPSGNPRTNQRLSLERAEAVINRIGAMGIDTSTFEAIGYGDTRPSAQVGPETRAYYDRRVEFSVVPLATQASFSPRPTAFSSTLPTCAADLDVQAQLLRQYYAPGAITAPATDIAAIVALASDVARCDGARLRIMGHFTDQPGTRENPSTARLRALVMMSALVGAGLPSDQILVAAPSFSAQVPGQPNLPRSRVDFQVVSD